MTQTTEIPHQPPWEPPTSGTEVEHLLGCLTRLRTTFRWKADGLDLDGLSRTVGASELTLGRLLKHLACVEDEKFGMALSGAPYGPPWAGMPDFDGPPQEYAVSSDGLTPDALYQMWDDAVRRSDQRLQAALAAGGLGQRITMGAADGFVVSLRRLLFDLLEEYGRHTGHADLLREAVDGRVGEDPPEGVARSIGQLTGRHAAVSERSTCRLRTGIVVATTEETCTIVAGDEAVEVRYAGFFPTPRVERVSPGHLVAIDGPDAHSEVVWRWFDAVVQDVANGGVRLWEPAHGSVLAQPRSVYEYRRGSRAYLSAGLAGAQWWVAGPVVDCAEGADVELGEVEGFLTDHRLLAATR